MCLGVKQICPVGGGGFFGAPGSCVGISRRLMLDAGLSCTVTVGGGVERGGGEFWVD